MTSDPSFSFRISVDPKKHPKVPAILDKYRQRHENISHKYNLALERLYAEEERGTKIDQYVEPAELVKLPRMNQLLGDEDIEILIETIGRKELYNIGLISGANAAKIREYIFSKKIER